MSETDNSKIELKPYYDDIISAEYDIDRVFYDLNSQIDLLSSHADQFDYIVSIGSG